MNTARFPLLSVPLALWRAAFDRASLDMKLIVGLILVAVVGLGAMYGALSATIAPSFDHLEQNEANRQIERTNAALDEFAKRVETAVRDYGAWNESYDYLIQPTREFEKDTFSLLAMTNLDVAGMAYVRFDGDIIFSRWVDIEKQIEVQTQSREFDRILSNPALLAKAKAHESIRFYAKIGDQLAAVSTARVIRTDGSGTPLGFVVMARKLGSSQLTELLSQDAQLVFTGEITRIPQVSEETHRMLSVAVRDLNNAPVATVYFIVERSLTGLGHRTLWFAALASALVMLIALFVLSRLIKRLAVDPLRSVEGHMQRITRSGDMVPLPLGNRRDEIGSLMRSFNLMMSQLKDLREQLEIQSFKLGRTESAVGLMHNVRNGLNPVSIILAQVTSGEQLVSQDNIDRAVEELREGPSSPERQQKLLTFLDMAFQTQSRQLDSLLEELESARTYLTRVIELIGDQQATAHQKVEAQLCDAHAVIEQNAALARYSSTGRIRFSVEPSHHLVVANRVLLSQVIGNLFGNAVESIQAARRKQGLIEVSIDPQDGQTGKQILIRVRDNGEGFDPSRSKQLFEQGFSTRREKSGGLGLHWCAHALQMMDGTLTLSSDGKGLGAVATIMLPAAAPQAEPTPAGSDPARTSHQPSDPADEDRAEPAADRGNAAEAPRREIQNRR